MAGVRRMKKLLIVSCVVLVLATLVCLPFWVDFFMPWTRMICREVCIDITSGRIRRTRYVYFIKVADNVQETALSRICREVIGEPGQPVWKIDCTFSPSCPRHSPHHIYHGANSDARMLAMVLNEGNFTKTAKTRILKTFFVILLRYPKGGETECSDYIFQLSKLAFNADDDGEAVDVNDLSGTRQPQAGSS